MATNKVIMINLGWSMARLIEDRLVIVCPSDSSESVYSPAESVSVYGVSSLVALRDALIIMHPIAKEPA